MQMLRVISCIGKKSSLYWQVNCLKLFGYIYKDRFDTMTTK